MRLRSDVVERKKKRSATKLTAVAPTDGGGNRGRTSGNRHLFPEREISFPEGNSLPEISSSALQKGIPFRISGKPNSGREFPSRDLFLRFAEGNSVPGPVPAVLRREIPSRLEPARVSRRQRW